MRVIRKNIPRDCNIFLFGDDHEGALSRHDDGWNQLVDMMHSEYDGIKPEGNLGIDHGDIIEAILVDDNRYDGGTTFPNIIAQLDMAKKHRHHIKEKLIAILDGNHPKKLWKFVGPVNRNAEKRADPYSVNGLTEYVCRDLGVEYGTWSAIIEYADAGGSVMFRQYCAHGFKSINSTIDDPKDRENSMLRSLRRILQRKAGNCVLMSMGHTHQLLVYEPTPKLYISTSGDGIQQAYTSPDQSADFIPEDQRWYVNTGSFFRTYAEGGMSTYSEIAGYDPVPLGFCIAKVRGFKMAGVDRVVL